MKKIEISTVLANLASATIGMRMSFGDDRYPKEKMVFLSKRLGDLFEQIKPDRSISVASLVINSFFFGQEFGEGARVTSDLGTKEES